MPRSASHDSYAFHRTAPHGARASSRRWYSDYERKGRAMEKPEDFEIDRGEFELTRREFLIATSAAAVVAALPRGYGASSLSPMPTVPPALMNVAFKVNGQPHELELDSRTTLLDALREHLHLTGSKKG